MLAYPAIDIRGGRCVRLSQGRDDARTDYYKDPVEPAIAFAQAGAAWIHVVDLDGAFGDRVTVGFSIPTDDDTVRQVVEPHAPTIPGRWAAVERLAKAGIAVNLAVTPLMAVHDPQAFARRARASGAAGAWVGGLRLLKRDPFYQVLADHGWRQVLNHDYAEGIRAAFRDAFPAPRRTREPRAERVSAAAPMQVRQPGLFDADALPSLVGD